MNYIGGCPHCEPDADWKAPKRMSPTLLDVLVVTLTGMWVVMMTVGISVFISEFWRGI